MNCKTKEIDFSTLGFSKLFLDYLHADQKVTPFFHRTSNQLFDDELNFKAFSVDSDVLDFYNKDLALSSKSAENIEKLKKGDAFCVVTGQQTVVFGGPLFVLYKAFTCILLAKKLEEIHHRTVVPVFWIADEDHDLDEILHLGAGKSADFEILNFHTNAEQSRKAASSVQPTEQELTDWISLLAEHLRETEFTHELLETLKSSYKDRTLGDGFRHFLNSILGKYGVVFFGSNHPKVKEQTKAIFKESIKQRAEIKKLLTERTADLQEDYHGQVHVSDTLLFYFDEHSQRQRVDIEGNVLVVGDKRFSEREFLELLERYPERFSPNVFLRPLIQDSVLPNLAYVGGPAEIAYNAQLSVLYPLFSVNSPCAYPRYSVSLVEPSENRFFDDLGLEFHRYKERIEDLEKEIALKSGGESINERFNDYIGQTKASHQDFSTFVGEFDSTLTAASDKTVHGFEIELNKLRGKLLKSIKEKESVTINRIRKVQASLFPQGNFQERMFSIVYLYNKYGTDVFDEIYEALSSCPEISRHKVFRLSS